MTATSVESFSFGLSPITGSFEPNPSPVASKQHIAWSQKQIELFIQQHTSSSGSLFQTQRKTLSEAREVAQLVFCYLNKSTDHTYHATWKARQIFWLNFSSKKDWPEICLPFINQAKTSINQVLEEERKHDSGVRLLWIEDTMHKGDTSTQGNSGAYYIQARSLFDSFSWAPDTASQEDQSAAEKILGEHGLAPSPYSCQTKPICPMTTHDEATQTYNRKLYC